MEASGHGKIILLGEHAVVHGRPALAMALGRGCIAHGQLLNADQQADLLLLQPFGTRVEYIGADQPLLYEDAYGELLARTFATSFADVPAARPRLSISAELLLPAGAGLGSSAALSVAVARAIDLALGRTRSPEALLAASMRWEQQCHGNPSGVDSAMAVYGGVAEYRRGQPLRALQVARLPTLVVGHSGAAPSTREMVERVAEFHRRDKVAGERIFDGIAELAERGRMALLAGDDRLLGELMVSNQRFLAELGLSTDRLEMLCEAALAAGAFGAKLTGGGGGGCMIALCADAASAQHVRAALQQHGADAFIVEGAL